VTLDRDTARAAAVGDADVDTATASRPDVARHAAELFGTPADPDATPLDQRHVPRGRVLLEWIGDASPYGQRQIAEAVRLGMIPAVIVEAWKRHTAQMTTRIDGVSHHTLSRERDRMSETITFGPHFGTYAREVSAKDADTILSGPMGHQFRLVGYAGEQPADRDPVERFVPPGLRDKVRSITTTDHRPEALAGVMPGNRTGVWTP